MSALRHLLPTHQAQAGALVAQLVGRVWPLDDLAVVGSAMTQPSLGDWFPLDADTIRTAYLKAKAARLAGDAERVIPLPAKWTMTTLQFLVLGDTGTYHVWLRPHTSPWTAACSRGGIHDHQAEGAACSHGLAAAVAWELAREAVTA
jgi:hypothetical protein